MLIDVFLFFLCLFATYRSGGAKGPGIFFIIPCTDSYQKVRAVISTIILLVLVMIIITDSNTNAMNRLYFSKSICLFNCSKHKPCIFFRCTVVLVQARLWGCGRGDVSTPSFGSHLNPISTRGADYAHQVLKATGAPDSHVILQGYHTHSPSG